MGEIIGIIAFLVISSLLRGNRNNTKNYKKSFGDEQQRTTPTQEAMSEWKKVMEEISDSFDVDKQRRGKSKEVKENKPAKATLSKKKDTSKERHDKKQSGMVENKERMIPENYISGEGVSANSDYNMARENKLKMLAVDDMSLENLDFHIGNARDLKRAIIMKEILDKPLSLRKRV